MGQNHPLLHDLYSQQT